MVLFNIRNASLVFLSWSTNFVRKVEVIRLGVPLSLKATEQSNVQSPEKIKWLKKDLEHNQWNGIIYNRF